MVNDRPPRAVVIGGGLGGLAAATLLARDGWSVTVLERASRPGGRARSLVRDDWVFNQGAHALLRGGAAEQVLGELGVELRGRPARARGYAQWRDKLYSFPAGPATVLTSRFLSPMARLELLGLFARVRRPASPDLAAVAAGDWLAARLREPTARAFALALVRLTTYSSAPERISAQAALNGLYQGIVRGALYLDGGWQSIVDRLLEAARGAGVDLRCGARAVAIEHDRAVTGVVLAGGCRLPAQAVVVAAGPTTVCELLARSLPAAAAGWRAVAPLRVASLDVALHSLPRPRATLALGVDRPLYLSVHSAAARLAPDGGALLHAMRYHAPDERADARADCAELERLLDRAQPGWRDVLAEARFVPRLTVAHARCDAASGGLGGRPAVAVRGVEGLALVGDWVGDEGQLADAVLASARQAARLLGWRRTAACREVLAA